MFPSPWCQNQELLQNYFQRVLQRPRTEGRQADIGALLFARVNRELQVACNTAKELKREGEPIRRYVLHTISVLLAYLRSMPPEFVDEDGTIQEETDRDFELADQARREFEQAGNDADLEIACNICNAYPAFVCFELHNEAKKDVRATAIRCFRCGLNINSEAKHLAHFHYGNVTREVAQEFLKNIGHL